MRSRSLSLFSLVLLLLATLLSPPFSRSQVTVKTPQAPPPHLPPPQIEEPPSPADEARTRAEKEMAKKANQQRQDQIKQDTEKLLQLATELKTYVDKTNENILSLDVIKKADQIEKLAHSVKEKMRSQ